MVAWPDKLMKKVMWEVNFPVVLGVDDLTLK